ncbi:MAG: GNAT family N-acetyltransferase [Planctomycetota bacterium]|nr:GNAT family N-acetyltransferase [Planctomycetota bacterium]
MSIISRIKHKATRVAEIRKQYGSLAVLQWTTYLAAGRLCNLEITSIVTIEPRDFKFSVETSDDTEFRFLEPSEVEEFSLDPSNDLLESDVAKAHVGIDHCFAAIIDGRLAGYGWYALEKEVPVDDYGLVMSYPQDKAYMYNGFTHPDFRGRRLHGIGMGRALLALADRGIGALVSDVNWTNWPSLRSCARLGYRTLGNVASFAWGSRRVALTPKSAKALGISFVRHPVEYSHSTDLEPSLTATGPIPLQRASSACEPKPTERTAAVVRN